MFTPQLLGVPAKFNPGEGVFRELHFRPVGCPPQFLLMGKDLHTLILRLRMDKNYRVLWIRDQNTSKLQQLTFWHLVCWLQDCPHAQVN
jgi:hypothetical protein